MITNGETLKRTSAQFSFPALSVTFTETLWRPVLFRLKLYFHDSQLPFCDCSANLYGNLLSKGNVCSKISTCLIPLSSSNAVPCTCKLVDEIVEFCTGDLIAINGLPASEES